MKVVLTIAAVVIAAFGWVGSRDLTGQSAAAYLGGALTLAGAIVICLLFMRQARWLGLGGAAVVALLGAGRNLPALWGLAGGPVGPAELGRLAIMVVCVAVFVAAGRALLVERGSSDRR